MTSSLETSIGVRGMGVNGRKRGGKRSGKRERGPTKPSLSIFSIELFYFLYNAFDFYHVGIF